MDSVKYPRVLIYDDENMHYIVGYSNNMEMRYDRIDTTGLVDYCKTSIPGPIEMCIIVDEGKRLNNIELDPTTMKRIAKFNKEQEIARLDEVIKEKEQKIKDLEDILQDRSKRVEKIKEFIANVYNIPIDDGEYDYDDYY